ncbi:zinc finger MYM-type protein 1-like [Sycon ciliatum]|uniref:zinc finger MYM-type protein 1-like n=1 Tax=Sycon ciliatum TaxID=27933 RepID=UPI0020A966A2|eukprot:scpid51770/ scgid12138/ Zinc finger MYM-type protein 1
MALSKHAGPSLSAQLERVLVVEDKPFQPRDLTFPLVAFGVKNVVCRSFQPSWFSSWEWLHWDSKSERAFCHTCCLAVSKKLLIASCADGAFLTKGFQNWKDATTSFRRHESSECHREAVERLLTVPATTKDVGELLSSKLAEDKRAARESFLKILSALRFLARQGLPMRGDGPQEEDGNFSQLLKLTSSSDPAFAEWLQRKSSKYTGHDMQNEILQVMAHRILRGIIEEMQGQFFTVMVDETTDSSTIEQMTAVFRWVDDQLEPHEEFIGMYALEKADAATIFGMIKDVCTRLNLPLEFCRGQCYDGASVMRGHRNGVAAQLLQINPRALYTHCYGHALNLACQDMVRDIKCIKDCLNTVFELSKLLKYSAKRNATYQRLKDDMAPDQAGFRTLCPTRWTTRSASLASIVSNYSVLQASLTEFESMATYDAEMSARVSGIAHQFSLFSFLFGVMLGRKILGLAENLSKTLQKKDISAAEGQAAATVTLRSLTSLRNDTSFDTFWADVVKVQSANDVDEPVLARKRKTPARFAVGTGQGHYPESPADHYKPIYFAAIDTVMACIKERFDQPGYKVYSCLEGVVLKAANGDDYSAELARVEDMYATDINVPLLQTQLPLLKSLCTGGGNISIGTIKTALLNLGRGRELLSEIFAIMKLILVMPASNATSERSFSALRRLKTYLRTTMAQARLNALLLLHVHKDKADLLSLRQCGDDFVAANEHRLNIFGKFQ